MRIVPLIPLLLAGCGGAEPADQAAPAEGPERIDCRIGNSRDFERFCTIELGSAEGGAGRTLTVRKPDGGFRRLLLTGDGRGVVAADGAEQARVTIIADDRIEVAIGGDIFRLPATVRR
ncbi:MAG TPA: hypothetical protein VN231_02735 [Allosphingosinicella sp.]|nr:hypothetical protein [Allosphingosinicella sp.]